MQAVVGIVRRYAEAERLVEALREIEIADRHIRLLSPPVSPAALRSVPTTESEQPGIGKTLGSVVGGAAGTAGGLAASAIVGPGGGPIVAAGSL